MKHYIATTKQYTVAFGAGFGDMMNNIQEPMESSF